MIAPSDIRTEDLAEASRLAAESVFTMMLGLDLEPLGSYEETDARPYDGVVALVSFTGDSVGVGMFCCHEDLACRIGAAMLGHPIDRIDADVLDGIGEMANMIVGNLKEQLEPRTGPRPVDHPALSARRVRAGSARLHQGRLIAAHGAADTAIVTSAWIGCPPIVISTGVRAFAGRPRGTTALIWATPCTRPGAPPWYNTFA